MNVLLLFFFSNLYKADLYRPWLHLSSTEGSSNSSEGLSHLPHHVIFIASIVSKEVSQRSFLLAGFMLPNFKYQQRRCQSKSSLSKLSVQSGERNGHF